MSKMITGNKGNDFSVLVQEAKFRKNFNKIKSFMKLIYDDAKDCVGGKKVFIPRKNWKEFEKIYKDISENESKTII